MSFQGITNGRKKIRFFFFSLSLRLSLPFSDEPCFAYCLSLQRDLKNGFYRFGVLCSLGISHA